MPLTGFKPMIPTNQAAKTYASDSAATGPAEGFNHASQWRQYFCRSRVSRVVALTGLKLHSHPVLPSD